MTIELIAHPTMVETLVQILKDAGMTLVEEMMGLVEPNLVVVITPAALWDAKTVDQLLSLGDGHGQLIEREPYRSWLARRGGVAEVLAWIENTSMDRLPLQLQRVLRALLNQEHYATTAQRLFLSRARYYRLRQSLFEQLSDHLNSHRG